DRTRRAVERVQFLRVRARLFLPEAAAAKVDGNKSWRFPNARWRSWGPLSPHRETPSPLLSRRTNVKGRRPVRSLFAHRRNRNTENSQRRVFPAADVRAHARITTSIRRPARSTTSREEIQDSAASRYL